MLDFLIALSTGYISKYLAYFEDLTILIELGLYSIISFILVINFPRYFGLYYNKLNFKKLKSFF